MKKSKILSIVMAAAMAASLGLTACKGGDGPETDPSGRRILKWEFLKAGIGTEVYEALASAYMEEHPDVLVKLVPNVNIISTTSPKLETGNNLADLYSFRDIRLIKEWVDNDWVEDISDVYAETLSSGKTVKDSMTGTAAELSLHNEKYWAIPEYISLSGFVYNKTLFEANGWEVPETTKELDDLCKKIKAKGIAPIVYCGAAADGYIYCPMNNWFNSYLGVANLDTLYEYASPEVFNPDSVYGTAKKLGLQELQKYFLNLDTNYTMEGSKGKDHIEAQTNVIVGEAAMIATGSWFETEMSKVLAANPDVEIGFMRFPVISDSSGNVLHAEGYTTVDNKEVIQGNMGAHYFIPKAAANKDDAKDFLAWLCEPKANGIYTRYSSNVRPFEYADGELDGVSAFGKDVLAVTNNNYVYTSNSTHPAALAGVVSMWPRGGYPFFKIQDDLTTIDEYLKEDYDHVTKNWSSWQERYGF